MVAGLIPAAQQVDLTRYPGSHRWIDLLVDDDRFGLAMKPNLSLNEAELGFSFSTNCMGLRGPRATEADDVICGTSYAFGVGVNEGNNWWELSDIFADNFLT